MSDLGVSAHRGVGRLILLLLGVGGLLLLGIERWSRLLQLIVNVLVEGVIRVFRFIIIVYSVVISSYGSANSPGVLI